MSDIKEKKFDINPHVIRQLGEELVPDEMTALVELVKNAYDADADYVKIDINTKGKYSDEPLSYPDHKGYIVVEDSGIGMNEDTIIKSWLTISYSSKRAGKDGVKKKTNKDRTPLGDKGLGRLSTQRLADYCEIFTTAEGSNNRIHVAFDWRDFDTTDQLSKVPVRFNSYPSSTTKGTKLVLSNLHSPEVWTGDRLISFKEQIVQVISPFSEVRRFFVFLSVNGETIDVMQKFDSILSLSLSSFEFSFDGEELVVSGLIKPEKLGTGNSLQSIENYKAFIEQDAGAKFADYFFNTKKKDQSFSRPKEGGLIGFSKRFSVYNDMAGLVAIDGLICNPGPFYGKIYDFTLNENSGALANVFNKVSEYKEYVKNQAGVKLYRDGFAVLPFGFKDDDWLGLRKGQTSGSSFYGLRPDNTLGYFAISEGGNSHLKDKTDRTGLISNEYSTNFVTIARDYIIASCNSFIESVRRSFNEYIRKNKQANTGIKTLRDAYSQIRETAEISSSYSRRVKELQEEVSSSGATSNRIIKENESLFGEDIPSKALSALKENASILNKAESLLLEIDGFVKKAAKISESVDYIEPKIETLEQQLDDFSSLAAVGLTAESITHEFPNLILRINDANAAFRKSLERGMIDLSLCKDFSRLVSITTNAMTIQLRHISPALRYARESKESIDVCSFFEKQKNEFYDSALLGDGIAFSIDCKKSFSINVNIGRFIQVIDNLTNNSVYWLKHRLESDSFSPEIRIIIDKPWIYVSDNGRGITPSIEESIFDPFVTTKPKGQGRGLGLFIVRQLLDAIGCYITLDEKRNEFNRRFVFAINLSNIIV
mgnify:CR=1 FL=1